MLLEGMIGYCRTADCLHRYITSYFGEQSAAPCAGCSNCDGEFETVDVSRIAKAVSRCVHDVEQRLGAGKLVQVLRGSDAQEMHDWRGLDGKPTYGMLKDISAAQIRDVIGQMTSDGYLSVADGRFPTIQFGPRAVETVQPDFRMLIKQVERSSAAAAKSQDSPRRNRSSVAAELSAEDAELFERLRALRTDIARENGVPPYIVFSDKSLRDMCVVKPVTDAQFLSVNGVGQRKLEQYGERFMNAIRGFSS